LTYQKIRLNMRRFLHADARPIGMRLLAHRGVAVIMEETMASHPGFGRSGAKALREPLKALRRRR